MLAGGTGVTPMYQVANAILKNPADKTQITLLFANVSADDILIEDELTNLQALSPQFKVCVNMLFAVLPSFDVALTTVSQTVELVLTVSQGGQIACLEYEIALVLLLADLKLAESLQHMVVASTVCHVCGKHRLS